MPSAPSAHSNSARSWAGQKPSKGHRNRLSKPRSAQQTRTPTPPTEESDLDEYPTNIDDNEEDDQDEDEEVDQNEDEPDLRFENISKDQLYSRP
jgi:hypothetical protein